MAKRAMRMGIFSDRYTSIESLPLHGAAFRSLGLGVEAHAASHHGIMSSKRFGGPKFDSSMRTGYFGSPQAIYVDDDDAELFWPGSFRQVDETVSSRDTHGNKSSATTFASCPPVEASLPDLTLRL